MTTTTGTINHGVVIAGSIDSRVMVNQTVTTEKATPPLYMFESKNKHFAGREDILERIEKAIIERKEETDSFRRTIVLVGFGGMGKSEIAKSFAEKFRQSYDYVVWVNAQTEDSVQSSFAELVENMEMTSGIKISFKSLADVPKIQFKLASTYKNGLFIFDNAERLKTEKNQLGVEKLLYKKFLHNKPTFLVTSRNGHGDWGGTTSQIKFINIDSLTKGEAINMLKNYLHIKPNTVIPKSLETAIYILVRTLGGYPLGLHLVGSTIVDKADEISLDGIESLVNDYIAILKEMSPQDLAGVSKYELALEKIYNQTIKKMKERDNGNIAIELLNIMSCLNPNQLYLGLVDAIYSGTTCKSYKDNEVKNLNVRKGLKVLMDYSIVKKDKLERLEIHRLIQQCARKTQTFMEAMSKICNFFELNEDNTYWRDHILTLFDTMKTGVSLDNEHCILCLLVWQYCLEIYNRKNFDLTYNVFDSENYQEPIMLKLAEICYLSVSPTVNWDEKEPGILCLSQLFKSQFWVTRAILAFVKKCLETETALPPSVREKINSFIMNQCLYFPMVNLETLFRGKDCLLKTIYGYESSRNVCDDSLFLKKLFNSPREEFRPDLWKAVWDLQSGPNGKEGFVQDVSSINGINFIIPMLIFSCPKAKNEFASKNGFLFLSECLLLMLVPSNKPKICLDIKGFTKPFLDVFKSWLETRRERIPEILAIIATVFALLLEDNETYFQNQFTVLEQDFEREITKTLVSHGPHILLQWNNHYLRYWLSTFSQSAVILDSQRSAKWNRPLLMFLDLPDWVSAVIINNILIHVRDSHILEDFCIISEYGLIKL